MIRSLQFLRIVAALTSLSIGARSLNSINLELENYDSIDLSALGTPNLDQYNGTYDLTVNEKGVDCRYTLQVDFDVNVQDIAPGPSDFEGSCAPNDSTGNAPDGLPWHAPRRHWMKFPDYVFDSTGFDHLSIDWVPCGRAPAGFRKARYDLNFYTVIPQYRAFMVCDVFKIPSVCQYNQTSYLGRGQFSLPRLARDPTYLANMPLRFQPDPEFPEAFQTEGLTHYDKNNTPQAAGDWRLPSFLMTTYDAAVVSWRAMIPHSNFDGKATSESSENQLYVYQTMPGLPSEWSTSFDGSTGRMSVFLQGSASMCGSGFDRVKAEQEYGIVFEGPEDNSNPNNTVSSENMIN